MPKFKLQASVKKPGKHSGNHQASCTPQEAKKHDERWVPINPEMAKALIKSLTESKGRIG
jgi:hypothetical protein